MSFGLRASALASITVALLGVSAVRAEDAPHRTRWVRGPTNVDLGSQIAEVAVGEGMIFAGEEDTRRLLQEMGNLTHGSELGLVTSSVEGENWFIVFEWRDVGFIKDDAANEIDADALLKSIQASTEAANQKRKSGDTSALHVIGWAESPHYDRVTHNLTWAIRGRDDAGGEVVNYNVRLLGRDGVMAVTFVDAPAGMAIAKPKVDSVVQNFKFKRGKTYAEWVPGDKVAAYGLTALVAAGAGAAAVKTGLFAVLGGILAKAWKAVAVGVLAFGAALVRAVKGVFGGRSTPRASAPPPPEQP